MGFDPCIAWQIQFDVPAGRQVQAHFILGECDSAEEARSLVDRICEPGALDAEWRAVGRSWQRTVGAIRIETPSKLLNETVNGWLLYQTLACRLWGRTAFYQSGGAFGFRDQLQDAAAFTITHPELTRRQILLHAAHQFVEGDVLHWWHPPTDEGIRTRFADDLLWLPYVTATYVRSTGDQSVLDEKVRFLSARALAPEEDEAYLFPVDSGEEGTVYEHCCRALDRSLTQGRHGLPLFGAGDWNDGMNRVGRLGRGESVWLGQFLFTTLGDFLPLCEARGDVVRIDTYSRYRERMREAVENAWDGAWYRRGYYDDGTPLGSHASEECRIDCLTQAWAVLSGIASAPRAEEALQSVEQHLIDPDRGLIRLLTPPFQDTAHDPGYIRGYVRGVRENGGQYTHAAVWVVMAMARLGWNDRVASSLERLGGRFHTATPERMETYGLEPYVIAADIYGADPYLGRGGWSWYTGSAGWMLRAVVESLLGVRMIGGKTLAIQPCIPDEWPGFTLRLQLPEEDGSIQVVASNPQRDAQAVLHATLDGEPVPIQDGIAQVPLPRDGQGHEIAIRLGPL